MAALDGALHAAKALQRRYDQQTPAGIASTDIAVHATASAAEIRVDIQMRAEEFLAIWAALAKVLGAPDPQPASTRPDPAPEAVQRPPVNLATISGALIGLAQLAIARP